MATAQITFLPNWNYSGEEKREAGGIEEEEDEGEKGLGTTARKGEHRCRPTFSLTSQHNVALADGIQIGEKHKKWVQWEGDEGGGTQNGKQLVFRTIAYKIRYLVWLWSNQVDGEKDIFDPLIRLCNMAKTTCCDCFANSRTSNS